MSLAAQLRDEGRNILALEDARHRDYEAKQLGAIDEKRREAIQAARHKLVLAEPTAVKPRFKYAARGDRRPWWPVLELTFEDVKVFASFHEGFFRDRWEFDAVRLCPRGHEVLRGVDDRAELAAALAQPLSCFDCGDSPEG